MGVKIVPHINFFRLSHKICYKEEERGQKWASLALRNIRTIPLNSHKKKSLQILGRVLSNKKRAIMPF